MSGRDWPAARAERARTAARLVLKELHLSLTAVRVAAPPICARGPKVGRGDIKVISPYNRPMPSQKPVFPLRLPADLRVRAEGRAVDLGISLNSLIAVALDAYLAPEVQAAKPRVVSRPADVSRNMRCPCGSGKKFKRCCGA